MSFDPENVKLYNDIVRHEVRECGHHRIKYNLQVSGYDPHYDAVGLAYYKILNDYPDNIELVAIAREQFLK